MPFERPAPSAVNFTTTPEYLEPGKVSHAFSFQADTYTQPAGDALAFVETWHPYPNGLSANFKVPSESVVMAVGEVTLDFFPEGHFIYTGVLVQGAGAAILDFTPAGHFTHGIKGAGAATLDFTAEGHAKHGIKGVGAVIFDFTPAAVATVLRYEIRGEVRKQGILVDRRVRAYNRATGVLVGDQNTVAGKFKVPAGFSAAEHYVVPIDLASDATDWAPPCANRLVSVLASDTI